MVDQACHPAILGKAIGAILGKYAVGTAPEGSTKMQTLSRAERDALRPLCGPQPTTRAEALAP